MAGQTTRFGFTTLDSPSDTLGIQGFKFVDIDRRRLDALLEYAERHQHTGQSAVTSVPPDPPHLRLEEPGQIPASASVYYRYGVVDVAGQEQVASRIASVITPSVLAAPGPPVLKEAAGGVLVPGVYRYGLSAFAPSSAYETPLSTLAIITASGSVELTVPAFGGSEGFNIYRRGPMDLAPLFLQQVSAGTLIYVDDGQVQPDPLRSAPTANTTSALNAVRVTAPSVLDVGETWRVYRTFDLENWYGTLIAWNAGEDVVDTGLVGGATGSPLAVSSAVGGPMKVDIASETTGILPATNISTIEIVDFVFPGQVTVTSSSPWQWVNEFNTAKVLGLRANLGQGSVASGQAVIVAIEYRSGTSWVRYPETATIPVGATVGPYKAIAQTAATVLPNGAPLRAAITQAGGSTSTDLVIAVRLECQA